MPFDTTCRPSVCDTGMTMTSFVRPCWTNATCWCVASTQADTYCLNRLCSATRLESLDTMRVTRQIDGTAYRSILIIGSNDFCQILHQGSLIVQLLQHNSSYEDSTGIPPQQKYFTSSWFTKDSVFGQSAWWRTVINKGRMTFV